ncbi:MAG: hypothetical protein LBD76_02105 [Prevotellaceae bacterium]|jgi:hypothetical protein|nr:hypothetical protein [Prevotellaceae bacterium]
MKKIKNSVVSAILILLALFAGYFTWQCYKWNHPPYSAEINSVLFMAGGNRSELEKVLKHYSRNPSDSLKLRAAEFLIANMPDKVSRYYDAPLENVATALLRWTSSSNKQLVKDTYGLGELIVREDVKYITGDYLIENIELAFKVWQEQPWCKYIPFDVFCEDILPYRVSTEPLENWRVKALTSFYDIYLSFKGQPDISAVEACTQVNKLLPQFRIDKDFLPMSYSMLMATTRSTCYGIAAATIFAMRALGIPVTQDYTPLYPYSNLRHSWNAVRDSSGKYISFAGTEIPPGEPHQGNTYIQSKVYRRTFGVQNFITEDISVIPPVFRDSYFKDVSSEYPNFDSVRAPVNVPRPAGASEEYVYLAMLTMDERWEIIARSKSDGTTVLFPDLGYKIVYLPVYYVNDMMMPAGNPFRLDSVGNVRFFETSTTEYDTFSLSDIKAFKIATVDIWSTRMLKGVFEGANKSDFSDSTALYTISKLPAGFGYTRVKLHSANKFRYIRYRPPKGSYCNVAEIGIYGSDGKKLSGVPIGNKSANIENDELANINNVFDEDLTTFYNALGAWVGLDLGEPKQISEIQYFPRNDNCEVFYWNGAGWQLVGKLNINNPKLKVPHGALLRLKNVLRTAIHEDRVFFLHNGFQEISL